MCSQSRLGAEKISSRNLAATSEAHAESRTELGSQCSRQSFPCFAEVESLGCLAPGLGKGGIVSRQETLERLVVDEKGHIVECKETQRYLVARTVRMDNVSSEGGQECLLGGEVIYGQQAAAVEPRYCLPGEAETPGCKVLDSKLLQY